MESTDPWPVGTRNARGGAWSHARVNTTPIRNWSTCKNELWHYSRRPQHVHKLHLYQYHTLQRKITSPGRKQWMNVCPVHHPSSTTHPSHRSQSKTRTSAVQARRKYEAVPHNMQTKVLPRSTIIGLPNRRDWPPASVWEWATQSNAQKRETDGRENLTEKLRKLDTVSWL